MKPSKQLAPGKEQRGDQPLSHGEGGSPAGDGLRGQARGQRDEDGEERGRDPAHRQRQVEMSNQAIERQLNTPAQPAKVLDDRWGPQ